MGGDAEGRDRLLGMVERVRGEGVVRPAPFLAEGHEAGVPERLEMEREEGLAAGERGLEIARALLALSEEIENPQAADIREGVKERGVALKALDGWLEDGGCHASTYLDILMYASGGTMLGQGAASFGQQAATFG